MKVRDVMNSEVTSCQQDDSLQQAAHAMWERDIGCLPVVNPDYQPVGMITDRDICMAAFTQGNVLASMPVADTMSRDLVTCSADDTIEQVGRQLSDRQLHRLPVVKHPTGKLVGIISLNDIARAGARKRGNGVSLEEVGRTLAAICTPRTAP